MPALLSGTATLLVRMEVLLASTPVLHPSKMDGLLAPMELQTMRHSYVESRTPTLKGLLNS